MFNVQKPGIDQQKAFYRSKKLFSLMRKFPQMLKHNFVYQNVDGQMSSSLVPTQFPSSKIREHFMEKHQKNLKHIVHERYALWKTFRSLSIRDVDLIDK